MLQRSTSNLNQIVLLPALFVDCDARLTGKNGREDGTLWIREK
jgi:hypothetical protein